MIHRMNLRHNPFTKIKERTKTIEMRLNDEKRSLISIGDTILFTDLCNGDVMECSVINLYWYLNFEELYRHHDKVQLGYEKDDVADPWDMLKYYSENDIEIYGVVGIEVKVQNI